MKEVHTDDIGRLHRVYPSMACIVTSNTASAATAMSAAWHTYVSHTPPMYAVAISPKRYTYHAILESGEFVVNFLPFSLIELIEYVGANSSRWVDKFSQFGIETESGARVSSPILKEAYANYECRMRDHHLYGDHELIVGEVVAVHYDTGAFTQDGLFKTEKVKPALYIGGDRYVTLSSDPACQLERKRYKVKIRR